MAIKFVADSDKIYKGFNISCLLSYKYIVVIIHAE